MTTLRQDATMTPAEAEAIVARLAARDETGALSVVERARCVAEAIETARGEAGAQKAAEAPAPTARP